MREKLAEMQQQQGGGGDGMLQPGQLSGATAASIGTLTMPEGSYDSEDFDKYLPASARTDQAPPSWDARRSAPTQSFEPPSRAWQCFYKLQNGFVIGASLGGAVGFLCKPATRTPRHAATRAHVPLPSLARS